MVVYSKSWQKFDVQRAKLTRGDRGKSVLLRRGAGITGARCDSRTRRRVRCRRRSHGGRAGERRQRGRRRWWRRGWRRGWKRGLCGARRQGTRKVAGVAGRATVSPRIARCQAKLGHIWRNHLLHASPEITKSRQSRKEKAQRASVKIKLRKH